MNDLLNRIPELEIAVQSLHERQAKTEAQQGRLITLLEGLTEVAWDHWQILYRRRGAEPKSATPAKVVIH